MVFFINVSRYYCNLNVEYFYIVQGTPWKIFKVGETMQDNKKNRKTSHWFPDYQSNPKIATSHIFVISGGYYFVGKSHKIFSF